MAASIVRTLRARGVDAEGVDLVSWAHAVAMAPRVDALEDDHHPLYLHPGRTVLVLVQDAGVVDPEVLAAAALCESEDEEFRVHPHRFAAGDLPTGRGVAGAAALASAVPPAHADTLAEDLVTAPETVRLVAVAERLDHLRHAHLRSDVAWRRQVHAQAEAVYLPIAQRTHPRLAERYAYWCRTFPRRFLG